MLNYLRESLHWMHLTFFKPLTLEKEARKLSRKESLIIFLKVYTVEAAIYALLLLAGGGGATLAGYSFDWKVAFSRLVVGLFFGLFVGLVGGLFFGLFGGLVDRLVVELVVGLFFGLVVGLVVGLVDGLSDRLDSGLVGGLFFGLVVGLFGGLVDRPVFGLFVGLFVELVVGLSFGLFVGLFVGLFFGLVVGLDAGLSNSLQFASSYLPLFLLTFFRPFYLPLYLIQSWRAAHARDPFRLFRHSPVYWDEVIATPLPRLKEWLVDLVKRDRERGLAEILFVAANRPYQRKAAYKALLAVAEQDLQKIHTVEMLTTARQVLRQFPEEQRRKESLIGLSEVQRRINTISTLSQDYQSRVTLDGRLKVLEELRGELETLRSAMALTAAPVGTTFQPLATHWLELVNQTDAELRRQLTFTVIQNPYVAGNPLEQRDENIFVGRTDIIRALERFILNTDLRPSLLLYGNRRTGKSSTLKNLPRLLSSQFEPVYIDCQDAKWYESDQAFCFNLAQEIFATLQQHETVKSIAQPQLEQFETNAFTRLDQYLDQFEKLIQQRGKRILLSFDEYEGLQESITNADISKNVLGKLRNIIQHRERIVVLVSGSHRFDELTGLNWASYLINTRTLELSFLDEASARELLTQPVPKLQYEDGVVDEVIRITHCQPYLLQAVASELVNYLNDQQRTTATMDDLKVTIEKVLVSAGSYFANTWTEGRSDEEQSVMLALAMGEAVDWAAHPTALRNLLNAEIVEASGNDYQLTIDLFRRWILKNKAPVLPHNIQTT